MMTKQPREMAEEINGRASATCDAASGHLWRRDIHGTHMPTPRELHTPTHWRTHVCAHGPFHTSYACMHGADGDALGHGDGRGHEHGHTHREVRAPPRRGRGHVSRAGARAWCMDMGMCMVHGHGHVHGAWTWACAWCMDMGMCMVHGHGHVHVRHLLATQGSRD